MKYKGYIVIELTFLNGRVWYCSLLIFLSKWFKFQPNICNRCHDLLMMSMNHSNNVIIKIKDAAYCCIISKSSKSEAINLMQNVDLLEKKWKVLKNIKIY